MRVIRVCSGAMPEATGGERRSTSNSLILRASRKSVKPGRASRHACSSAQKSDTRFDESHWPLHSSARLASTRLPTKNDCAIIAGSHWWGRVYKAVRACALLADVIIATDSDEIMWRLPA